MRHLQHLPRWLLICMALCLIWCLILALNLIPELRGDFGWRWPYEVPEWLRLIPLLIAVVIYITVANRLTSAKAVQWWSFLGALIIPLTCLFLLGDPLYLLATRTLSGLATGPHLAGSEITDVMATLRDWPAIMPTYLVPGKHTMLSVHVALSPPGLPLIYAGLDHLLAGVPALADPLATVLRPYQCQNFNIMLYSNAQLASAWFGILMPLWAALTVFPLYRAGGKYAALWWPLIPSLSMFTPTWNTFYPLVTIIIYLLLDRALRDWYAEPSRRVQSAVRMVLAGVLVSCLTFANFSLVPLIAFFGLYTALVLFKHNKALLPTLIDGLRIGIPFVLGVAAVWIVYYVLTGITPLALLSGAMSQHLSLDRPYLPWIYLHLYDLALFTGFPVVILSLVGIVGSFSKFRLTFNGQGKPSPYNNSSFEGTTRALSAAGKPDNSLEIDPLGAALAVTLIALALSGTARGETGRVWLFFVPFILIVAARQLQKLAVSAPASTWLVTATQAVALLTAVAFLRVMGTELSPPPVMPPTQEAAAESLPTPIRFDSGVSLIGQHSSPADKGLNLTLSWRTERQLTYPYYLSALPVAPDGHSIPPSVVWQPFDTKYPMTCWMPGQVVTETHYLPLGDNPVPGNYWISLTTFALVDGQPSPVKVTAPDGHVDTQVGLGPFTYP